MSVKTKKVFIHSPRAFQLFAQDLIFAQIDASPVYTEVAATVTIIGNYTEGNTEYDYDYTKTKTWDRVALVGSGGDFLSTTEINGVDESLIASCGGSVNTPEDNEVLFLLRPSLYLDDTISPNSAFFNPKKQSVSFFVGSFIEEDAVIGTTTFENNPPLDIISDIIISSAGFVVDAPSAVRSQVDLMRFVASASPLECIISEDVTTWSASQWRDFRGTYSNTNVDSNGVSFTLDVVIN